MNNAYQKWLAGEGCCNAHNFIHIETSDCKKEDVCECERILLEISNLHTDDLVLQEQIDELSGDVANKLDASAYTPVDLSDYYTKEQVDELIPSVPSLSGYATEQWVQEQGYLTEHQPLKTINGQVISGTGNIEISTSGSPITVDSELSLVSTNPVQNKVITEALNDKLDASAYTPTEQVQSDWNVTDSASTAYIKNKPIIPVVPTDVSAFNNDVGYLTEHQSLADYVTNSTLIQYITNLQQQIDSLTAAISGCCGESGETQYRWIIETGENDYWCSGTTKMSKEKQQSSTDGVNWTDTGSERSGSTVLEENCVDCGYVPVYGNKLVAHYNNGNSQTIMCTGEWNDYFIDGRDYRDYETGAYGLTAVEVGDCPTTIAGYGFSGCTSLTSVTLTNNVVSIGAWSFDSCTSLSSITIPSSVTYISQNAFDHCMNLSSVTVNATTPPYIGSGVFANTDANLVIYVPANSVNAYKTDSHWSTYASRIQAIQ